jgi:hypothetical protein
MEIWLSGATLRECCRQPLCSPPDNGYTSTCSVSFKLKLVPVRLEPYNGRMIVLAGRLVVRTQDKWWLLLPQLCHVQPPANLIEVWSESH